MLVRPLLGVGGLLADADLRQSRRAAHHDVGVLHAFVDVPLEPVHVRPGRNPEPQHRLLFEIDLLELEGDRGVERLETVLHVDDVALDGG